MPEAVNVIIVHPSQPFRGALERAMGMEPGIRIMATARNCRSAMDIGRRRPPDLLVADAGVDDCLEALEGRFRQGAGDQGGHMSMIVMAGRRPDDAIATIKALEAGAFDFVLLPERGDQDALVESVRRQLSVKLRHFAAKRIFNTLRQAEAQTLVACPAPGTAGQVLGTDRLQAVVIGVSTGGPRVLADLVPELCRLTSLPVLIAQHMPPGFTTSMAQSLDAKCPAHRVVEGADGQEVAPSAVYIAPGGRHMAVRLGGGDHRPVLAITDDPPDQGCRPSANVLFRSAAAVYGSRVAAVVLTGMGSDGSNGLADLKRAGAHIIALDESTSIVWGMPGAAVATGLVDEVLPVQDIPGRIAKLMRQD